MGGESETQVRDVVWKFTLHMNDVSSIDLPRGAKVLHVGEQHGTPTVWVRVDPRSPIETVRWRVAGTGHPLHHPDHPDFEPGEHVGSFMLFGGKLVFHVFAEAMPF